jgi:hypothetical protein
MIPRILAALIASLAIAAGSPVRAAEESAPTSTSTASFVPTFHCLGLYWSPAGGEAGKKVLVTYREAGQKDWRDGFAMRYNPVKTPECKGDYRGSLVNLKPGTPYDIALTLEGTETRTSLKASTWSEKFPVASTVKCENRDKTLTVDTSGTAEGYVLYDGTGTTIDTANKSDVGIAVEASYVILRGFAIKNVKQFGISLEKAHHVVIEGCDISKWGSTDENGFGVDMQGAINSRHNKGLHAVVIQRCKLHHPSWDSNSWAEDHNKSRHPAGQQAVVFWEPQGNNVIRYNECWSDDKHYFNDVMGGAFNASYRGYPGSDSDVYGNYIANCWDDGLEIEGGSQNVRVWGNYIEDTMMSIGNAACSIGPLYIWRNVSGRSYSPPGSSFDMSHGNFLKMGYADDEKWMTGHMYIFNNTLLQAKDDGPEGLGGSSRALKHVVSRNNILHVRSKDTHAIATDKRHVDNDFDYDLYSAKRVPADAEKHGINDAPAYVAGAGFSFDKKSGVFLLAPDSPGVHKAEVINNFCEAANGTPNVGAQEEGAPPMVVGVKAEFIAPNMVPAKH